MTQWYISKYARLHNGEVELVSYSKAESFEVACRAEKINLPNDQFYHAENRVGSLLPKINIKWVARDKYSHKPQTAQMQVQAEETALRIIKADNVEFDFSTKQMLGILSLLLTKAQYALVLKSLMRKPSVMQELYENRG